MVQPDRPRPTPLDPARVIPLRSKIPRERGVPQPPKRPAIPSPFAYPKLVSRIRSPPLRSKPEYWTNTALTDHTVTARYNRTVIIYTRKSDTAVINYDCKSDTAV